MIPELPIDPIASAALARSTESESVFNHSVRNSQSELVRTYGQGLDYFCRVQAPRITRTASCDSLTDTPSEDVLIDTPRAC
jgi:hypothetical protein